MSVRGIGRSVDVKYGCDLRGPRCADNKTEQSIRGWDRKIRNEDHRLASRGLPSDGKGANFSVKYYLTIVILVIKFLNTLRCNIT